MLACPANGSGGSHLSCAARCKATSHADRHDVGVLLKLIMADWMVGCKSISKHDWVMLMHKACQGREVC